MAKHQKIVIGLFLTFGVILWIKLGFGRSEDGFSPWVLTESQSPKRLGAAVFLIDAGSFGGSETYFFVRDAARSGTKPLRVGGPYSSDGPIKVQEAVWSQDGSVICVRVGSGKAAGKGFSKYDGTFWRDAYDFRKHQPVSSGTNIDERSKSIAYLLAERGGESRATVPSGSASGRNVSLSEAQTFDTFTATDENLQ